MSFYNKSNFAITHHALIRAKERLDWGKDSNLIIEAKLKDMLSRGYIEFENNGALYYRVQELDDYYFIVIESEKDDKLLLTTITKISMSKRMNSI